MTGTEKQVQWAQAIRTRMMDEASALSALLADGQWKTGSGKVVSIPADHAELPIITRAFEATRTAIETGNDARWFCDRADNSVTFIVTETARALRG